MNPLALEALRRWNMPVDGLRSKNWDEFAVTGAPPLDFMFPSATRRPAKAAPSGPCSRSRLTARVVHPAAVEGPDDVKRRVFGHVATMLRRRIELFLSLPLDRLDAVSLTKKLADIGNV